MKKVMLTALVSLLVYSLLCTTTLAQTTTPITGSVASASGGQKIPGATIILASDKKVATTAGMDGNFTLRAPAGTTTIELIVTHVGFEKKTVKLQPGQTNISILLEDANALNEVVVTALHRTTRR